MIFNYLDFISEKKLEILLESKLGFSKGFTNTLLLINLPISKQLLSLNSKDIETRYNYIDVSDENDSVTFIPDRKAQELLGDAEMLYKVIDSGRYLTNNTRNFAVYDRLGFDIPQVVYQPEVGTIGRIISETHGKTKIYCLFECTDGVNEGRKTILNKQTLEPFNANYQKVWATNRNKIKIGRIVRSLLQSSKIVVSDSEIEKFVNQYKSTIDVMNDAFTKFDIVTGDNIINFYGFDSYEDQDDGSLANSCMANVPDEYLYIYANNPEVCQLVILYSDRGEVVDGKFISKKIKGRALIWTTREEDVFMDRIYTTDDSDIDLFQKFAEKNGWWCKKNQTSSPRVIAQKGNQTKEAIYHVDLKKWKYDFPYLDTLCFFNSQTGELSNDKISIKADRCLQSTGGDYDTIDIEEYEDE